MHLDSTSAGGTPTRPLPRLQLALGYSYLKNTLRCEFPNQHLPPAQIAAERREREVRRRGAAGCQGEAALVGQQQDTVLNSGCTQAGWLCSLTRTVPCPSGPCEHLQAAARRAAEERFATLREGHAARAAEFQSFLDQMVRGWVAGRPLHITKHGRPEVGMYICRRGV